MCRGWLRGGGIAGITLAIALAQSSTTKTMSVHLYEAAPKFTETGAGIAMFRRPWQVMKRLNLGEEIKTVANIPDPEDGLSMYSVLKFKGFPELMPLKIFRSRCQSLTKPTSNKPFDMLIPCTSTTSKYY